MSPQVRPYTFKEHVDSEDSPGIAGPPVPPKDDRKYGMKKRTFSILFGCGIIWILAIALGLGLGLGLGLHKKNDSYDCKRHRYDFIKLTYVQERRCVLSRKAPVLYWRISQRELLLQKGCL